MDKIKQKGGTLKCVWDIEILNGWCSGKVTVKKKWKGGEIGG